MGVPHFSICCSVEQGHVVVINCNTVSRVKKNKNATHVERNACFWLCWVVLFRFFENCLKFVGAEVKIAFFIDLFRFGLPKRAPFRINDRRFCKFRMKKNVLKVRLEN